MKFKELYKIVKYMFSDPDHLWFKMKDDEITKEYITRYITLPLLLAISFSYFLGHLDDISIFKLIIHCGVIFFINFLVYGLSIVYIRELLRVNKVAIDFEKEFALAGISLIPYWLISIITGLFPFLSEISFLALYGVFILWSSFGIIMHAPHNKKVNISVIFTFAFVFTTIVIRYFSFMLLGIFI